MTKAHKHSRMLMRAGNGYPSTVICNQPLYKCIMQSRRHGKRWLRHLQEKHGIILVDGALYLLYTTNPATSTRNLRRIDSNYFALNATGKVAIISDKPTKGSIELPAITALHIFSTHIAEGKLYGRQVFRLTGTDSLKQCEPCKMGAEPLGVFTGYSDEHDKIIEEATLRLIESNDEEEQSYLNERLTRRLERTGTFRPWIEWN